MPHPTQVLCCPSPSVGRRSILLQGLYCSRLPGVRGGPWCRGPLLSCIFWVPQPYGGGRTAGAGRGYLRRWLWPPSTLPGVPLDFCASTQRPEPARRDPVMSQGSETACCTRAQCSPPRESKGEVRDRIRVSSGSPSMLLVSPYPASEGPLSAMRRCMKIPIAKVTNSKNLSARENFVRLWKEASRIQLERPTLKISHCHVLDCAFFRPCPLL